MMTVSDNIRQLFAETGKKQIDLAEFVGVRAVTISTWTNGHAEPRVCFIPWIAKFFSVPIERLFKGVVCLALVMATAMAWSVDAAYVTAPNGLNIRAERSTDSEVIEVLPFGFEVEITRTWKKWAEIETGFVSVDWISDANPLDDMKYMGTWRVTAYAYTGSPCANGSYPTAGYTIAHNSLPFGTEVYIEGVGFRTVEDRGPSWLGSEWCDIYMGDTGSCVAWGDQYRKVWTR